MKEYMPNEDITELNSDDISPDITTIRICNNTSLKTLSNLPADLEGLYLHDCTSLTTLPNLPLKLQKLTLSRCTSLKTLPNLPLNLEVLDLLRCTSLTTLPNLPPKIESLDLSDCTSLTTLPDLPAGLKVLDLSGFNSLTTLPNLPPNLQNLTLTRRTSLTTLLNLPDGLVGLFLNDCTSLTTLPNLPPKIEVLDLSGCASLTTLTNLPPKIEVLDLPRCTSLTTLPNLPDGLVGLHLNDCTSLTTLPNLPDGLVKLDLSGCTSLQNTPALIAQLEELEKAMQERSPDCILTWPDHLDRSEQITKIKQDIISAYKQFYHDNPSVKNKSPDISDHANYPVLSLMHRFMNESLDYRGGVNKVIESILPIIEQISENPSILEFIDPIAQNYLAACVDQPVAGVVIIANIAEIDKQTSLQEKIDQSKFLFLVNKINEECVKLARELQVGQEDEVEFANAMIKQVNDKLIASGDISKPIPGTPDGISYEDTVKSYLSDENIEKIYQEVKSALSTHTIEEISEKMANSAYEMFWASQSLGVDVMAQYKKDKRSLQECYLNNQEKGLMSDEDFKEQELQITSKILKESKDKTVSFLEEEKRRIKRRRLIDYKIFGKGIGAMELDPRLVKTPPELCNIDYYIGEDESDDVSPAQYDNELDSDKEEEDRSDSGIQMTEVSSLSGQKRGWSPSQ